MSTPNEKRNHKRLNVLKYLWTLKARVKLFAGGSREISGARRGISKPSSDACTTMDLLHHLALTMFIPDPMR